MSAARPSLWFGMRWPGRSPREPIDIVVYSRPDCHLCDVAKGVIREVAARDGVPIALREVDVDQDPALRERYTNDVPVIFIEGRKAFKHRIDPRKLSDRFGRIETRRRKERRR